MSYRGLSGAVADFTPPTMNGSGIRDTSRVLGISQNTVISELKKRNRNPKCELFLFILMIGAHTKENCRNRNIRLAKATLNK